MDQEQELLNLASRLVEYIHAGDVDSYRALSAPDLTCYETDVAPYRIDGVDFHVGLMTSMRDTHSFESPSGLISWGQRCRCGDCGVVTYTRLMTYATETGPRFAAFNESRVFSKASGQWQLIHFHRSAAAV